MSSRGREAIVIGGSIGGLCAARVLADHFERVVVLDRDTFPEGAAHRKGVPQSRHPHALLDGGRRELERLFPGFERTMKERGALEVNPGLEMATLQPRGWAPRSDSPFTLLFSSRILIESVIRGLAEKLGNVEFVEDTEVTRLVAGESEGELRVSGVETRRRADGATGVRHADLVVDASGRETRAPDWLRELGLPEPEKTVVDADAGYSTRWYELRDPSAWPESWWWKSLWINPVVDEAARPEEQYFALLFPVEHNRWIVTTASWGGRELPKDPESFDRIVGKLRSPVLAEALALAEPISPVYYRRSMQNTWRHYERWSAELPGFLATADAVCAFNPVYGQGMSSASFCAGVLERCLAGEDPTTGRFARRFFREQAAFLQTPWTMAVSRDRQQVPRSEGEDASSGGRLRLLAGRIGARYMRTLGLASARDPELRRALFDVVNLSRHPQSLLRDPRMLARVFWARLRQGFRPVPAANLGLSERPPPATA